MRETSSLTNPARRARTSPGLGPVPEFQFSRGNPSSSTSHQTDAPGAARTPHVHRSMCKNRRPCRTARHSANNTHAQHRTGRSPCIAKTEWNPFRESPGRFSRASSHVFPLALHTVLWSAREHFDQIVVQAIEKLALEGPFKLGMVEVARVHFEIIGMHGDVGILEFDDDLDRFSLAVCREVEQGMLVEAELGEHTVETSVRRFGHTMILLALAAAYLTCKKAMNAYLPVRTYILYNALEGKRHSWKPPIPTCVKVWRRSLIGSNRIARWSSCAAAAPARLPWCLRMNWRGCLRRRISFALPRTRAGCSLL